MGPRFRGDDRDDLPRTRGDRGFRLEGTADYVRGKTDRGPPARIPPWSAAVRGVVDGSGWTGTLEVREVGRQTRVASFETPTAGYTLLNASLVLRPVKDQPDLKVFVEGTNLTDTVAREHASFLKDVAPLPRRGVRLGLGFRF